MIDTKRNIFVCIFYFLFCVVFMNSSLYSQNDKKINALYKEAAKARYSDPDKAIKIGEEILRISGNNIDYKINGNNVIATGYFQKREFKKSLFYLTKANEDLYLSTNELLKIDV